jgi:O-antigen ligase
MQPNTNVQMLRGPALRALLIASLASALLFPPILIHDGWPKAELSDLLLPFTALAVLLVALKNQRDSRFSVLRNPLAAVALFVLVIVLSMAVNNRLTVARDWLEVVKFTKFGVLLIGFTLAFTVGKLRQVFLFLAPLVVAFNALHFFDVLGFNQWVEPFYAPKVHLDVFGYDSEGNPGTRRIMGSMGNPNVNALMFLYLLIAIAPGERLSKRNTGLTLALVFVLILGVMLSQSRTAVVALAVVILVYGFLFSKRKRMLLGIAAFSVFAFFLMEWIGNTYLVTIVDPNRLERSGNLRFAQWQRIIDAMPGKWLLGNAPSKEYFEANGIYSESEYFLILFRYGFAGLLALAAFGLSLLLNAVKQKGQSRFILLAGSGVYLLSAATNNPLHSMKLAVVIAAVLALGLVSLTENEVEA